MTTPTIEQWKIDLAEAGDLHNEDCCVNFDDARSCDGGIDLLDCCDNMRFLERIGFLAREEALRSVMEKAEGMKSPADCDCGLMVSGQCVGQCSQGFNHALFYISSFCSEEITKIKK